MYDLKTHFVNNFLQQARDLFWTQFQVLLYNSHNLKSVICLHIVCCIWPLDRILSGATTLDLSGPGSDGNEGVFHVPQNSSNTEALSSDGFNVISRTLVSGSGVLASCRDAVGIFYSPSSQMGRAMKRYSTLNRSSEEEPYYQMQFRVMSRVSPFLLGKGSYLFTGDTVSIF